MDAASLQDRINQGLGTAARAIGVVCDAYRPTCSYSPLASGNRFLELNAAFNARDPRFTTAGLGSDAVWYGVFDAAYLQPGDYLVEQRGGRTWFVAAMQSLLPALCVLTNRVVTMTRPGGATAPGINAYGGAGPASLVVDGYPASLLHGSGAREPLTLPADARPEGAVALLPSIESVAFLRGDLLMDDTGRRFVVAAVENNALGWRLDLRQVAS